MTKTILTFPQRPRPEAVVSKVCSLLGYRITRNVRRKVDLVMSWEDCTFRRSFDVLERLSERRPVLNLKCWDISKRKVDEAHRAVFGYGLALNPLEHQGPCVKKSNLNAMHDGAVIRCPVEEVDAGAVYQRVVNNVADGVYVEDIRVPVFGESIPFCYLKRRPVQDRFGNENTSAHLCETGAVLSPSEAELLLCFCRVMGLDYGELDVLRDADDMRLYVVDVNNTPFGPPNHLDEGSARVALERLSEAFVSSYL